MSGPESEKDTRHFEIDLTGWGLNYEVGDSMAVYPTNDPELVDAIIQFARCQRRRTGACRKDSESFAMRCCEIIRLLNRRRNF